VNRIELQGRVIAQPELRVTPAGNPLLRLRVDCGERPGELVMPVIVAGGEARVLAERLKVGSMVRLTGGLHVQSGRPSRSAGGPVLEITAHEICVEQAD
jgi:primosomal replication protein N